MPILLEFFLCENNDWMNTKNNPLVCYSLGFPIVPFDWVENGKHAN